MLTYDRQVGSSCRVTRWENIDGQAVCFESDGRVRLVVSDGVADLFEDAERDGVSADELVNRIVDEAERSAPFVIARGRQEPFEERWSFS